MGEKAERARQRQKEKGAGKRFKLPVGLTVFRVLPNARGTEFNDYNEYQIHQEVGPMKRYTRCGKKQKKGSSHWTEGECWLCDTKIPALRDSESASKRAAAERMEPRERFAVQIIYKDNDTKKWVGPVLWEMPNRVAKTFLGMIWKRENLCDPKKGYNLSIERTGTGKNDTRYDNFERDEEPSPVSSEFMDRLKTFKEVVPQYDEEKMKAAYFGHEQEETESSSEEEEEEKPKKKKSSDEDDETPAKKKSSEEEEEEEETPKKKKKAVDEEEEEPEPAAEDDETPRLDEDEEDVPKKKKKSADEEEEEETPKKKKKAVDEEEEVDAAVSDDTEDEEEEAPKKKKKVVDEEEEEEAPKKKKKSSNEDEEEETPKKKKKSSEEEDEEEAPKKKKKPVDEDED